MRSHGVPDGAVSAAKLAAALQDKVPYLTVTGADGEDGTGTATILVTDAAGNNLIQQFRIRTWISSSNFGAPVAQTDFSVNTVPFAATQLREIVADADYEVIAGADNSTLVMDINVATDRTVHVMAEVDGRIYSDSVTITGNV